MQHQSHIDYQIHRPTEDDAVTIVLHPHPLYEGTMYNKVVTTAFGVFAHHNQNVLRFNYPGVGASSGCFGYGQYEAAMAMKLLDELNIRHIDWCVGFSFGCWVSRFLIDQFKPRHGLVWIAPSLGEGLWSDEYHWPHNRHIIQGQQDELCPYESCLTFAKKHDFQVHAVPDATHFFHGKQIVLRNTLEAIVTQ